jgi:hypothetical protein
MAGGRRLLNDDSSLGGRRYGLEFHVFRVHGGDAQDEHAGGKKERKEGCFRVHAIFHGYFKTANGQRYR